MLIKKKTILQVILIITVLFVIRYYQQQDLISDNAPIFTSKTITGKTISSVSKNATLIHFWATWCKVCAIENDNIQNIAKNYKVLNIAISSGSDDDIKEYAKKNNLRLDNIINDNNNSLAKIFGVKGTPTSFIVKNNNIKFIEVGYTTEIGMKIRLWLANII